jgi:predicted DNA-binding transcriptional regulator YafY
MIRNIDQDRTYADLRMAVDLKRPVVIDYYSADDTRTVRTIEPFEITTTRAGHRLVRCMDRMSHSIRGFRLDRITAYRVSPRRGRFTISVPAPLTGPDKPPTPARWEPPVDLDAEWGDWLERTYDPDNPPYDTINEQMEV